MAFLLDKARRGQDDRAFRAGIELRPYRALGMAAELPDWNAVVDDLQLVSWDAEPFMQLSGDVVGDRQVTIDPEGKHALL